MVASDGGLGLVMALSSLCPADAHPVYRKNSKKCQGPGHWDRYRYRQRANQVAKRRAKKKRGK